MPDLEAADSSDEGGVSDRSELSDVEANALQRAAELVQKAPLFAPPKKAQLEIYEQDKDSEEFGYVLHEVWENARWSAEENAYGSDAEFLDRRDPQKYTNRLHEVCKHAHGRVHLH